MLIRRSHERGHASYGWLDTHHSFSFNTYYDPQWMGYNGLRVLNDDVIAPGAGFPTHPHREMEIITYVMSGAVAHKDSMGNSGVVSAGEVQVMSAGTGITHSEFNASQSEPLHLLQIWIEPEQLHVTPRYDQRAFPVADRENRLVLLAGPEAAVRDSAALMINADALMYGAYLTDGARAEHRLDAGRTAWLQVAGGSAIVNGDLLQAGDGAVIEGGTITMESASSAELLLFDLPDRG